MAALSKNKKRNRQIAVVYRLIDRLASLEETKHVKWLRENEPDRYAEYIDEYRTKTLKELRNVLANLGIKLQEVAPNPPDPIRNYYSDTVNSNGLTYFQWLGDNSKLPPGFKSWKQTYVHWLWGNELSWAIFCYGSDPKIDSSFIRTLRDRVSKVNLFVT